jgi:hypothetical protein
MKSAMIVSVLVGCLVRLSQAGVVFDFNPSTADSLLNKGASIAGTVTKPVVGVPSLDFGNDGIFTVPNAAFPGPAFSIESRFFLRNYSETDPNISEILAAFDCSFDGAGGTEGTDFRVGGGYNFPIRPSDTYNNIEDWIHPDELQKMDRAEVSKSIGEFALGVGAHIWKEIYTDRCIARNVWTHMVATWDGKEMRIFLNGHDATDGWRTLGVDLPAFVKPVRPLNFGAENATAWRHFDGKIQFVKIYDAALSLPEIRDHYLASNEGQPCVNYIPLESPKCGEAIGPATRIRFSAPESECQGQVVPTGYIIQFCTKPDFSENVVGFKVTMTDCLLGDLLKSASVELKGLIFLRIVADKPGFGKMASSAPAAVYAQSATLPAYMIDPATVARKSAPVYNSKNILHDPAAIIFDCQGRKIGAANLRNGLSGLRPGVYFRCSKYGTEKLLIGR